MGGRDTETCDTWKSKLKHLWQFQSFFTDQSFYIGHTL